MINGIVPLYAEGSGCDYHRVFLPMKHMGVDFDFFQNKNLEHILDKIKIVMFNRTPHGMLPRLLELKKKQDFKIVVDLDDYWILHPKHNMSKTWTINKMGEKIVESLKSADQIICTTSLLADKIKSIVGDKNIHVIPNALPFGEDQFNSIKQESIDGRVRFMYAGGGSHFWDLKTLTIPFQKVNNNPNLKNASFTLAGFNKSTPESDKEWRTIEKTFNLNFKLRNYIRRNTLHLKEYMNHYNHADVSLVPLEYNNFNRFKSNLKIIEAGCKNIPCIVSNVEPYSNEPNKDILLFAKNANEWYEHIKYCTLNPSFAEEKGLQLGEYVRENYDLSKVNEYRKQLFESLLK